MTNPSYVNRLYRKIENTLELYAAHIFRPVQTIETVYACYTDEHLRLPPDRNSMHVITPGTVWGHEYSNMWLSADVTVPAAAEGQILCAIPEANAIEILCFRDNTPVGIINSKNNFLGGNHSVMFVSPNAVSGQAFRLDFECYAGHTCLGTQPYEGYGSDERPDGKAEFEHVYNGLKLYVMDTVVRDAAFDLSSVLQIARMDRQNYVSQKAYECLTDAFRYIIQDQMEATEDEIHESARRISECVAPVLEKKQNDASRGNVYAIGHSHMDTAWLWPVSETIRKCARTYSEVLTLMDMYPDYTFIQSSALHLDWMRRYYPSIFEGIKKRVAEGRYEPNGGVWVECDCNITGGEAMARQFIYGQRFTRKYLDYTADCFWLPDTFGYNAAIPQIMQQSGVKYFYTTKLSWNDLNTFPAGTFVWKGIDGTEVLCHLNSTHSIPDPKTVSDNYAKVTDRYTENMRLAAYGYGDGGGGPTYGMLEYLKRVKDTEGLPSVKNSTVSQFMQDVEKRRGRLPVCDGELYLELHRGTLTKMHDVKKNNRLAEIALHDFELMNVLTGAKRHELTDDFWKVLLKNQFHDILPGTCIPRVYEAEVPEMKQLLSDVHGETLKMAESLTEKADDTLTLFNTLSFDRTGISVLDGAVSAEGLASQVYTAQDGSVKTAIRTDIGAMQSLTLKLTAPGSSAGVFTVDGNVITTPVYRVTLDKNGYISELYDIAAHRHIENISGNPLGTLYFGEDMPASWDNWDIDDDLQYKLSTVTGPESMEVVSNGSIELRLRAKYRFGRKSSIVLDTVFYADSRRIDYEATVDWQERHGLLKAGFDVSIRSATFKNEIQFGSIDRPTTRNNSIESAKFEVCNHKWSDMSETRYGVAVLNDCKYGISALESDMRLTLMKGGARPDPVTDIGTHTMRYALLPHTGAFSAETVVQPAYEFNFSPVQISGRFEAKPLFAIDVPNIICEAVKPAEDEERAYVLRLYECERSHTGARIKLEGSAAWLTNILEEKNETLIPDNEGYYELEFRPYEIKTVLVKR